MNKEINKIPQSIKQKRFFDGRTRDIFFLSVLALILIFAAWKTFQTDDKESMQTSAIMSENEAKVSRLLGEIDGVGEANVMICETEEGVQSVVVVCEGAEDLQVIMHVREAVAAALGTEEKAVKIYLKKE